ncbi:MAG: MFS transporter [Promethearchaeota archaeon]
MDIDKELSNKLSKKTKVSYGFANMANLILSGIAFTAITFYYNVKLGLDAELIGIAWLIFAIWNAINDPMFGFIQDRTKSDLGRRIPYIRYGAPIYGTLFILIWILPLIVINQKLILFILFFIMLFTFDTIYTIIGLVTYSLPAEMTLSQSERTNLMIYATAIGGFGMALSFILPVFLLTGDKSTIINPLFIIAMIILGILCAIILYVSSFFLKENKYTQLEDTLGIIEGLKETFKNREFLIFEVSNFSFLLAQTVLTTAIFYYVSYILILEGFSTALPLILVFGMVMLMTVIFSKLVEKYGLKKIYILGLMWTGLSFILFFFIGWEINTAVFGLVLLGIGFSAIIICAQAVMGDIIDYDETRTGKRRETTYSGINALLTKPAISIANWLFLLIIDSYGFNEKKSFQTSSAQLGIMIGLTIIPAIFILISAFVMIFYKLDGPEWEKKKKELARIHSEKEQRYLEYLKKK